MDQSSAAFFLPFFCLAEGLCEELLVGEGFFGFEVFAADDVS